jgi:hypothetical protein
MSDDIVTRLRETVDRRTSLVSNGITRVRAETQLMIEAADDIELLRAENKRLSDCLSEIYSVASFAVHGE